MVVFRVRKDTEVNKLASAIATNLKNTNSIELSCLGVGAINQAVKGIITARAMVSQSGDDFGIVPYFDKTILEDQEKTLIIFRLNKNII